nr:5'-3' exonuclease H3TH domain-containing protein [Acidihalobacter aeolianus]
MPEEREADDGETGYTLLVDSSIYIFRAWFTWPQDVCDAAGRPANAVHGFAAFVHELLSVQRPVRIAFAFDETLEGSPRRALFPAYKANRPPAPQELIHQFEGCRRLVDALGLGALSRPGCEADDLIGTLAAGERVSGRRVALLTGDKDLTQLVHDGDIWWDYARGRRLGPRGVERTFGVPPRLIADQLALAGDKSDNIPGIPGVGMTTAARLLCPFGGLEALLDDIPRIGTLRLRGAVRLMRLVQEHQDTVRLARRLTGIDCRVPIERARRLFRGPRLHRDATRTLVPPAGGVAAHDGSGGGIAHRAQEQVDQPVDQFVQTAVVEALAGRQTLGDQHLAHHALEHQRAQPRVRPATQAAFAAQLLQGILDVVGEGLPAMFEEGLGRGVTLEQAVQLHLQQVRLPRHAAHEHLHQPAQHRRKVRGRRQHRFDIVLAGARKVVEHRLVQRLLGREVTIQRGRTDSDRVGDVVDGDTVKTAVRKQTGRLAQDQFAALRSA